MSFSSIKEDDKIKMRCALYLVVAALLFLSTAAIPAEMDPLTVTR
jgi:hypothetical protein